MRYIFGLDPEVEGVKGLIQRRRIYGKKISRKVDTIADREKPALEQLRIKLLTGWYPASPPGYDLPELHNSLVNELFTVQVVVSDRKWMESRHHYRFLALFDEAPYIAITTSYPMKITTYNGWSSSQDKAAHGYEVRFYPPKAMVRGEVYNLMFKFEPVDGDPDELAVPGEIIEESEAFHARTLRAQFEALFLGERPTSIHAFSGLTGHERPGVLDESTQLGMVEGRAKVNFVDLYGGLFAGLAWRWGAE